MSAIYEVLRQLDEWRHLPAYQLERRVDVLFGMFLQKVIEKKFCIRVDKVIPEFPMHKALLECPPGCPSEAESHHSVKVDFAVFGRLQEERRMFLVELKTEMESLNEDQLENMKNAGCAGSKKLLEGVQHAAIHSESKHKYAHLIWKLLSLKCLQLCDTDCNDLKKIDLREKGRRLKPIFQGLKVGGDWVNLCVDSVVILPTEPKEKDKDKVPDGFKVITFAEFANLLEDGRQPFESSDVSVFADYLRHWAGVEAGRVSPWPQQH